MSRPGSSDPADGGHAPSRRRTLDAVIASRAGLFAARCYQCGKCTAGCPMAREMPLPPHRILRLVQLDQRQRVLADPSIWLCVACETCTARCPNGVDPAAIIDALRELALAMHPRAEPRPITAFNHAFIDAIARHGRIFELGLIGAYKLRTGKLLGDARLAPRSLVRGKLALAPPTIAGIADVRRIIAACRRAGEEDEGS